MSKQNKDPEIINDEDFQKEKNQKKGSQDRLQSLRSQIEKFGEFNEHIADELETNLKVKDIDEDELASSLKTITALAQNSNKTKGTADDILSSIPFFNKIYKKSKNKVDDALVQNTSVKDAVSNITQSLKTKASVLQENMNGLTKIEGLLMDKLDELDMIIKDIDTAMESDDFKKQKGYQMQLKGLKQQATSIAAILDRTQKDLEYQMQSTHHISSNIQNILPTVRLIMTLQTTLAGNSQQMENLKEMLDASTSFCDELTKKNAEASGKNMISAFELQSYTPVSQKALTETQKIDHKYMEEFSKRLETFEIEYKNSMKSLEDFSENNKKRAEQISVKNS